MDLLVLIAPFITLFAIMDPFASLPVFLASTKGCKDSEVVGVANKAVLIAGAIAVMFIIAGPPLLAALSITLSDFKVAGGIVLVLLGLENALDFSLSHNGKKREALDSAAVLIGTPLLTGPGLMTSLIILGKEYDFLAVLVALACALLAVWVIFVKAAAIRSGVGERIVTVVSRVIGLVLIAMGIAFIRGGMLG
ncbi:MAG: MarC family protein [Candidatus ainarchaeum sp.]|nr:MarC family protein [Candidatus ainarchaeum sp.]